MEQTLVVLTNMQSGDSSIYFQFYADGKPILIKI